MRMGDHKTTQAMVSIKIKLTWLAAMYFVAFSAMAGEFDLSLESGAPPHASKPLTETLSYGARIESEYTLEKNFDQTAGRSSHREILRPFKPSLAFSWRPSERISGYANFEGEAKYIIDDDTDFDGSDTLSIDKLYLDYHGAERAYRIRMGRQRFKDAREWMFDDTLDGITMEWAVAAHRLEVAALREQAFKKNILQHDKTSDIDHYWLQASHATGHNGEVAAFFLLQKDPGRDERIKWLGFSAEGEWADLDYWVKAAWVDGKRRRESVQGYGFDVGGLYRILKNPRVYLILGYAFGSGDEDDPDFGFRQTDFQDNSGKLGGVARIAYYGEVFDPELANLRVRTAGIGTRPNRDLSIDLIWHDYQQAFAIDELRDSAFETEPNGDSRNLGQEMDLVLGYRWQQRVKFELTLGRFMPGDAFDAAVDDSTFIHLEFRYNF